MQEQGYVDDTKRLLLRVGQELQQARAQGCSQRTTSELKRSIKTLMRNAKILDRRVEELEYVLREQAVPVVAPFPRVETRQIKRARLS